MAYRRGTLLVVTLYLLATVAAIDRRRFPGPYCETRVPDRCCPNRDDDCTVPIHDTLCYCDQFCAEHSVEDCCPDYEDICLGKPQPALDNQCSHGGALHQLGQSVKKGCNQCTCVKSDRDEKVQVWQCENHACINEDSLVRRVNAGGHGWVARTYSEFDGVALSDGPGYYLGTIQPKTEVVRLNPLLIDPDEEYERFFDSRDEWPGYIHPAMNQGQCAASWAFSTAGVAADRWSIQSQGVFKDQLSVQNIVSCNRLFDGCAGGRVEDAWYYLQRFGAVSEQCYPFVSGTTRSKGECKYLDELLCPNSRSAHEHKTTPPYRIAPSERQIMKEIRTQGPVQAVMTVYPDFYLYESGVYRHTSQELAEHGHEHSLSDTHSVKIIGWGEEAGVKYWRCVNSWGTRWGEDGTFRILRGVNESGIENFVVGVWARVEQHDLHEKQHKHRKHRRH